MTPLLYVLCCESSTESDQVLCKLAQFLGLQTELVMLRGELAEPPEALLTPASGGRVLALGRATLRQIFQRDWFGSLLDETRFVFVFGFAPADGESPELKWLTGGAIASVTSIEAGQKQFTVHSEVKYGSFPVSGKSYSVESGPTSVFSGAATGAGMESYITVDGHPLFLSAMHGRSIVFLLAEADLVDIDIALSPNSSLRSWYAQLVATTMFLRIAFGRWCWTSPITPANVVVDDPYLKKRYGYIHYKTLMDELERTGGALTVAFIPYNYKRSDPRTVELLGRHSGRFSIAVHGCDHTASEFASLDEGWLLGITACTMDRMEAHASRTKMPFDNVMVFPQGRFSTKAIRALKACGFNAAVNSTPWPVDFDVNPLTIRDLLQVAVTRYESFPVFVRRYPGDVFDYAFDALFQKPVLAVEHHGFFRSGYNPLASLVRDLSALSTSLVWMPLGRAVASSCVSRRIADGQFEVKHYAPVFRFRNPSPAHCSLLLTKAEEPDTVEAVFVSGKRVPFEYHSGFLKYEAQLGPGEDLEVRVAYWATQKVPYDPSLIYRFRASTRRILSEIRDNYLSRSDRTLALVMKAKRFFGKDC